MILPSRDLSPRQLARHFAGHFAGLIKRPAGQKVENGLNKRASRLFVGHWALEQAATCCCLRWHRLIGLAREHACGRRRFLGLFMQFRGLIQNGAGASEAAMMAEMGSRVRAKAARPGTDLARRLS